MRNLQFRELNMASVTLLMAVGMTLTACGSSGSSSSPSPTITAVPTTSPASSAPSTGSSSEPSSGPAAIAAIKANWVAFFDAKTPTARRIALLQNGSAFASVIKAQATSTLAQLATAKVNSVSLTGTTQAGVIYSILAGGQVALAKQTGVAVYQDGTWKVGLVSFCGLLTLENAGKTAGLPAGCSG
jgi:hypothetical protein